MGSSSKTEFLGLNRWIGSDRPLMDDFNADNQKLDLSLGGHLADTAMHLQAGEHAAAIPAVGGYTGNGAAERTVETGFSPLWGVVFAVGGTPSQAAFLSSGGSGAGAEPVPNGVRVRNGGGGAPLLNETGKVYRYILYRPRPGAV